MAGVKFQDYKGHKYRIKKGYLYGKGWHFGISVDAIMRIYGSIESYFDHEKEREQNIEFNIV